MSTIGALVEAVKKMREAPGFPPIDRVEMHEGAAVFFGTKGEVLGWMPQADFEQVVKDMEKSP